MPEPSASSLARRGPSRSSSTTRRRVGSAKAVRVVSKSFTLALIIHQNDSDVNRGGVTALPRGAGDPRDLGRHQVAHARADPAVDDDVGIRS